VAAAWCLWCLLLALHRTPWGGEGMDHRYLIPLVPAVAPGLAWALESWGARRPLATLLVLVGCAYAALRSWGSFLAWHDTLPFTSPRIGVAVGVVALLVGLVGRRLWLRFDAITLRGPAREVETRDSSGRASQPDDLVSAHTRGGLS
jgi:hypothetical protein